MNVKIEKGRILSLTTTANCSSMPRSLKGEQTYSSSMNLAVPRWPGHGNSN